MMVFKLRITKERRFSLKIISGKIRQYCPSFLYDIFLVLRYLSFPKRCGNVALPEIRYSDGSWVSRGTTKDLRCIQDYLSSHPQPYAILQIGIGNSSLFETVRSFATRVVGITVVQDEIDFAHQKYPNDIGRTYFIFLMNKYSDELKNLDGPFDYIVDNDLSAYACCHYHFEQMMRAYRSILSPAGSILIGRKGLGYFDSGFGLSEYMAKKIAEKNGFSFLKSNSFYSMVLKNSYDPS